MTVQTITFSGINEDNPNNRYFVTLNDENFIFKIKWRNECNCAFLSIADDDNNPIISGRALVNGLYIRNHNLPYVMVFAHINGEKYEPTIDTISTEFALVYDDESVVK